VNIKELTAHQAAEAVNNKEISARHLIETILEHSERVNKKLNTFTCLAGDEALKKADAVDQQVNNGFSLPLAGVPLAVKDDYCYSALPTGFGSAAFKGHITPYNASAVEKLIGAGAVVIGKTNIDDMGIGSSTATSPDGPSLNPWDQQKLAGSAGAAAVAAGQCLLALESDSGGALRQGASHCGVFGLRPTPGRVSRYGLNLFSGSFGRPAIAAAAPADLGIALRVLSGYDEKDVLTSVCREPQEKSWPKKDPAKITIAFPEEIANLSAPETAEQLKIFRNTVSDKGFTTIDCSLEMLPEALRAYYVIAYAEASSSFARYDGIRFGRAADAGDLEELYTKTRRLTFGPEAQRRSVFGTYLLSKGGFETYYRQALKVWAMVKQEFDRVFNSCDLLALPVVKTSPRPIGSNIKFLELCEDDLFTAPVSMAALTSISLPFSFEAGLPAGIQLASQPFSDEILIYTAGLLSSEIIFPPAVSLKGEVE
jgi:aspartyl-tRNA(Asn)/glutamyl-tRNA(Gln) amidotransferase subunit A